MNFDVRRKMMWKETLQNTFMTVFAVFALGGPLFALITWIFEPRWTEWSVGVYVAVLGALPIGLVFYSGARNIARMSPNDVCTVCDSNFADCECCTVCLGEGHTRDDDFIKQTCSHCHGTGKENACPTAGVRHTDESGGFAFRSHEFEVEMARPLESIASKGDVLRAGSAADNTATEKRLASELIEIGRTPKIEGGQGSQPFFWRPEGDGVGPNRNWDPRTREIGEQLYTLGDRSLDEMRRAHEKVAAALGTMAGHALSAHWHNIGEQEWMDGKGECWMH